MSSSDSGTDLEVGASTCQLIESDWRVFKCKKNDVKMQFVQSLSTASRQIARNAYVVKTL